MVWLYAPWVGSKSDCAISLVDLCGRFFRFSEDEALDVSLGSDLCFTSGNWDGGLVMALQQYRLVDRRSGGSAFSVSSRNAMAG